MSHISKSWARADSPHHIPYSVHGQFAAQNLVRGSSKPPPIFGDICELLLAAKAHDALAGGG